MTFSGEDLEEEAQARKEASSFQKRKAPELSLEWRDVTIQIRYCAGPDDEEQEFVELFPKVMILIQSRGNSQIIIPSVTANFCDWGF